MDIPYLRMNLTEKRSLYARMNRSYLNMEAVFSDETENFVTPYDPNPGDVTTFKLRTAKNNVEKAVFHLCGESGEQRFPMTKTDSAGSFDYYSVSIDIPAAPFRYFYAVHKNDRAYFYNKRGLYESAAPEFHFRLLPGLRVPDWARGAIMYQIFTDRFYNGDPSNDVLNCEYTYLGKTSRAVAWNRDVAVDDVCNFYGGDLRGVIEKLDYLQSLHVEVIYLNPVFVSPSNHKYDAQDYDHIDPHYGVIKNDGGEVLAFEKLNNRYATKYISRTTDPENLAASDRLFAELVEKAHAMGIRVILDGVFNHCGSFNKWMDKAGFYAAGVKTADYKPGAYRAEESPYHNYFLWYDSDWPNNDCYDGWWGNENHPKLNFENSPELYAYIMKVAKKWVSPPYNADGWRLDVAADLGRSPAFNHRFWRDFRAAVREANPDALVMAEHYGDASPWLDSGEWDTVMNYDAFMEPITWFLTGVNKHSEETRPQLFCDAMSFENAMRYHMSRMNIHALQSAMNELSNHDHSRFLTRTNRTAGRLHTLGARAAEAGVNKNVMMEAVVYQMTWPGAPTIYYGDEAGLAGWTDPDDRRPYPWGKEDETLLELHRVMTALRKQYRVLRRGSTEFLRTDYGIISYGRWDAHEKIAVVLNNNSTAKDVTLPVWKIDCVSGKLKRLAATFDGRVRLDEKLYAVTEGVVRVTAPGQSALVLALVN